MPTDVFWNMLGLAIAMLASGWVGVMLIRATAEDD